MIDFNNIPPYFKYYWDDAYPKLDGPEAYRAYFLKSAVYGKDSSVSIHGEPFQYQGLRVPNWQDAWVTYITVCRNAEATLEKAMESIFEQTYKKIEYILIDGNSQDGTRSIIERYNTQISFYKSSPDRGIYDAFNQGILAAKGQIIGILNADDVLDKNTAAWMVEAYDDTTDFTYANLYYKNENRLVPWLSQPSVTKYWYLKRPLEMPFPHPALLVKKSAYQTIGVFKTAYQAAADFELVRRLYFNDLKGKWIDRFSCIFSAGGISNKRHDLNSKESCQIALEIFDKKDYGWYRTKLKYFYRTKVVFGFPPVRFLYTSEKLMPLRRKIKKFLRL